MCQAGSGLADVRNFEVLSGDLLFRASWIKPCLPISDSGGHEVHRVFEKTRINALNLFQPPSKVYRTWNL